MQINCKASFLKDIKMFSILLFVLKTKIHAKLTNSSLASDYQFGSKKLEMLNFVLAAAALTAALCSHVLACFIRSDL